MNALSILLAQARNNAWANLRLLRACGALAQEELHATRVSFFPTIMKTLNHNVTVDWYYLDALQDGGRGRSVFEPEEPFADIAELTRAQLDSDRVLTRFVEGLRTEPELDRKVSIPRRDHTQVEAVGDILLNLFEHQIHHRGQVHAMLAGTRVPPPQLDEFFLKEELPLRRAELVELGLPLT